MLFILVLAQTLCSDHHLLSSGPVSSFILLKYHLRPGLFKTKKPSRTLFTMGANYSNSLHAISKQESQNVGFAKMGLENKHFSKKKKKVFKKAFYQ